MRVPATIDVLQEGEDKLEVPEIRVWLHPHRDGQDGDDTYQIFDSFAAALSFIKENPEQAEDVPLIAFRGYELNLWEMEPVVTEQLIKDAVDGVGRYA